MPDLCFGGSFNPIHNGHLRCAQAVAENRGYERIVLIPSAQPPHKPQALDLASANDRLAMCRLAITGNPRFSVCDIETRRAGPSYTIDTVLQFRRNGATEVHWLIGADMLLNLPKWHRSRELLQLVEFIVMARPGWTIDWESLPSAYRFLERQVVDVPQIDISATDIRRRVRQGQSIRGLTPDPVIRYIEAHRLWREAVTSGDSIPNKQ